MLNDDGSLSCRTRTSAPTATLRPNRPADGGRVPARDGYANELVAFLAARWPRSDFDLAALGADLPGAVRVVPSDELGRRASARPTLRSRCLWIILPGFIDLHDHLTWSIQLRWPTGRSLTTAMNGRIRGIGLLAEQSALPGNPDFGLRSADVRGDQGACRWGDLGPRGLLSSDKSSANHPCVRDLSEIWIGGSGFAQQQPVSDRPCAGQAPPARTKPIGTCCGTSLCARQFVPEGQ
ncbi:hypothetical protein ACVWW4_006650 [Bradyrhizobium sp. LB7.1]